MVRERRQKAPPPVAFRGAAAPPSTAPGQRWCERRFGVILAAVCILALLVRLLILRGYLSDNPLADVPINDSETYWGWAGRIADGQLFSEPPFFSAPLYPYVLGLLRSLGGTLPTLYVVQMLFDLAAACCQATLCRKRFGASVGILAAALFLALQDPASSALRVLPSSLHLILMTLVYALLVRVSLKRSLGRTVAAGAGTGLLCLAYAPALLLVPICALWLFVGCTRRQVGALHSLGYAASVLVVVAPATIHNWRACGDLFLVSSGGGITLRQGNHPNSRGAYTAIRNISARHDEMHFDAASVYHDATGREPRWKDVDRYFRNQALEFMRADPLGAIRLAARKAYWFLSARNYGDIYRPAVEIDHGLNRWLLLAPIPLPWLMVPALVGLVWMARQPLHFAPELSLFAVPLFVVVTFFYSPRYRLPAVPIIVTSAAWAFDRARHWRTNPTATAAVTVAVIGGLLSGPLNRAIGFDRPDTASLAFSVSYALAREGKVEPAIEWQKLGIDADPRSATARADMGHLLAESGRIEEALAQYELATTLNPDDTTVLRRMAGILIQQGRLNDAAAVLQRAQDRRSPDAMLLGMLAGVKHMQGDSEQARPLLQQALAEDPQNIDLRALYANVLIALDRWDEARMELERVLQSSPDHVEALCQLGIVWERLGSTERSQAVLEQAMQLRPDSPQVLAALGALMVRLNRLEQAASYYRRALALDPTNEQFRRVLEQLEQRPVRPGDSTP